MKVETRMKYLQKFIEQIPKQGHYNVKFALETIVEILKDLDDRTKGSDNK